MDGSCTESREFKIKYYIYIYCISVHIFICYTNIDSSELQSNVLNSQLEIKGKQKPTKNIYGAQDPIRVRVRLCLLFDLEREARVRYGSFLLLL